jgi:hypothetical protein
MLHPEGVKREAGGGERVEDVLDFGGALAGRRSSRRRPLAHEWVKPPGAVQLCAARVVGEPPSLEGRRER